MPVTPSIRGRKRMLKYHSSSAVNGFSPFAIGCFGNALNSGFQIGLHE